MMRRVARNLQRNIILNLLYNNCASSWSFTQSHTRIHGQQNIKKNYVTPCPLWSQQVDFCVHMKPPFDPHPEAVQCNPNLTPSVFMIHYSRLLLISEVLTAFSPKTCQNSHLSFMNKVRALSLYQGDNIILIQLTSLQPGIFKPRKTQTSFSKKISFFFVVVTPCMLSSHSIILPTTAHI